MARNTLVASLLTLPLALACEITLFSGLPAHANQPVLLAQSSKAKPPSFRAPRRGTPSISGGGATRSKTCLAPNQSLKAMLPKENGGFTLTGRPTVLVYVPTGTAQSAEFVIKDAEENDVYRATVPLVQNKSQLVALRLPASAPELQVGQGYTWYFSVVCESKNRFADVFIRAVVERIQPDAELSNQLQQAKGGELVNVYAESGIWYDSLATVLDLRAKNPNNTDVTNSWMSLLRSVGLEQFGNNPVIQPTPSDAPVSTTNQIQ